jgi:uncharacterized membrane protein
MNLYSGIKNYIKNIYSKTPLKLCLPSPMFSPQKEAAFSQYYRKKTIAAARFALSLGVFLYVVFGFLDPWIVPSVKYEVWLIRYAIVCPLLILSLTASYLSKKINRIQLLNTLTAVIAGIGIAVMMFIEPGYGGEMYYGGILLVIFYAYTFVKLQFKYAVIAGWIVTIFYIASAIIDKKMDFALLFNNSFFIVTANVMGMPVAFVLESSLRRDYQGAIMLKKTLRQVQKMSIFDGLTNIANRRYFDMRFPEEFNRMRRVQHPSL